MINQKSELSLNHRIIRYDQMEPCTTAFIDARTPGSDKKENFCLIGEGVAENADQFVHIDIPHGFNVGAARQPKGCKNSHHSHDTEEVFMVFSGTWEFTWGEEGKDGQAVLVAGDTVSIPSKMFRGFENVGDENDALMFAILGLDDEGTPGNVVWAPYVFEQARNYGLVLLEDGRLIDVHAGQTVPDDGVEQQPTGLDQVKALSSPSNDFMRSCVVSNDTVMQQAKGGLSTLDGVSEFAIIGPENVKEEIQGAQINRPHGFHLRRLIMQTLSSVPIHTRAEEEVLIMQSGELSLRVDNIEFKLSAGDLFSIPIGFKREFQNLSNEIVDAYVIRRSDAPSAATFLNKI